MFKVVREFVDSPLFFLLCDNRNCAAMARGDVSLVNEEEMNLSQKSFLGQAMKDGWMIGLDAQLCPGHAKLHQEAVKQYKEQRGQIVRPATTAEILASNKGKLRVV